MSWNAFDYIELITTFIFSSIAGIALIYLGFGDIDKISATILVVVSAVACFGIRYSIGPYTSDE